MGHIEIKTITLVAPAGRGVGTLSTALSESHERGYLRIYTEWSATAAVAPASMRPTAGTVFFDHRFAERSPTSTA